MTRRPASPSHLLDSGVDCCLSDPVSQRDWDDAHLINAAIDIHHDDPEFGYRFIADELAEQGMRLPATGSTDGAASSGCGRCTRASAV